MATVKYDKKFFNFSSEIDKITQTMDGDEGTENRTFDGLAYSGQVIPRHFIFQNLFIDLDSIQAKDQVPIFRDHDSALVAGHGNLYRDESGQLRIKGTLSKNAIGQDIAQLSDEGLKWELSIGAVPEFIEEVGKDEQVFVNGTEVVGPASIFRNTRVIETSFVPIGADSQTNVQVFNQDVETINVEVRKMETNQEIKTIEAQEEVQVEEVKTDLELIDSLRAELACACTEKKEAKSDLDKAREEIASLKEELAKLKEKENKAKLEESAAELGVKLSSDQLDQMYADLGQEKTEKVIKIMGEQIALQKSDLPTLPAEMTEKVATEEPMNFSSEDPAQISEKAKQLMAKLKEDGKVISFNEAVAKVSNWSLK